MLTLFWSTILLKARVIGKKLSKLYIIFISNYFLRDSIVGFYVEPLSVNHKLTAPWDGKGEAPSLATCSRSKHLSYDNVKGNPQKVLAGNIIFSYDVQFRESEIKWASRWDVYLSMDHAVPDKVHWFSIINSILIVFFLAVIVAMILIRSLHRDISQYNRVRSLCLILSLVCANSSFLLGPYG